MNGQDDAGQWDAEVRHLVQAHGAEPGRLIGYALPVNQLQWVHFDTHAALDIAQMRPPDGHIHRALLDPGRPDHPQSSYRPFLASPAGRKGHAATLAARFHAPGVHTGLPQTEMSPDVVEGGQEDVTGRWAELVIVQMRAHLQGLADGDTYSARIVHNLSLPDRWRQRFEDLGKKDPDQVIAEFQDELRDAAAAAAAHWSGAASFRTLAARPGRPALGHRRGADWEAGQ
jgi:hypothetical protein